MKKLLCMGILITAAILSAYGSSDNKREVTLFVGTAQPAEKPGILIYAFDQNNGSFSLKNEVKGISNPTYLAIGKDGKYLYSVSENDNSDAALYAYSYDPQTWTLTLLNTQKTDGAAPCYVWVDPRNTLAATANYNGGSVSLFPIKSDGKLDAVEMIQYSGGNPASERQSRPHLHSIYSTPDQKQLLANDLGCDKVYAFDLVADANGHYKAVQKEDATLQLPAGEGPRHTAFHPDGKFAYIIGELSGNVTALKYEDGRLTPFQTVKADTLNASGSADIHITPDGRFLYASNRLKGDGIAIFSINQNNGRLTKVGYQLTGIHPRNFAISPNGKYLLCACRDSNSIEIYRIDPASGLLDNTGKAIKVTKPMCVKF